MSDHSNLHLLIGGEKVFGGGRDTIEVIDPATAEVLGALPHASKDDLDLAISTPRSPMRTRASTSGARKARTSAPLC